MHSNRKPSLDPKIGEAPSSNHPYQEVLTEAAARAQQYLRTIHGRHVGVPPEALDKLPALGGVLPARGQDPRSVLKLLDEIGSPATMATMGGRFFGGVIGGALPTTVAAHWLADAWDQNACLSDLSPVSAYLEEVVLRWIAELLGLPAGCGGALVTGVIVTRSVTKRFGSVLAVDSIDLDVSDLDAEHSLHVSDLKVGEGIEIHENPETVVASIVMVKEVVLEPQIEEGAQPEVPGEAPAEPEAEGDE